MTLCQAILSTLGFKAHPQPSSPPSSPRTPQNISPPTAQLPLPRRRESFPGSRTECPSGPGRSPPPAAAPDSEQLPGGHGENRAGISALHAPSGHGLASSIPFYTERVTRQSRRLAMPTASSPAEQRAGQASLSTQGQDPSRPGPTPTTRSRTGVRAPG